MQTWIAVLGVFAVFEGSALGATHTLEGKFGRAVIDTERPSVTTLVLRRADGSLEPQSLLSPKGAPWLRGMPDWGTEALTFAADETGRRFESRNRARHPWKEQPLGLCCAGSY